MIKKTLAKADQASESTLQEFNHLEIAQHDMRFAYLHGYPGVVVSGIMWLVSACVALNMSAERAVWALLIGGVFIHPLSILLNKVLGSSGVHNPSNPLGRLAMEGTLFMILCMPLAYGLSFHKVEWFFQGMLLIIGGRYFHFATLYGSKLYWVLGIGLGVAAILLFIMRAPSPITLLVGAAIEIAFGVVMLMITRTRKTPQITN
ncbi:DUF7010 family protein [Pedobacter sp.]|uniref:DUF7010 family protein n=1 Tax=Pedobacter sp. TaxID=1411316 RepID=UPI003D7F98E3